MKINNCKCVVCNIDFYARPDRIKNGTVKYCSIDCKRIGTTKKTTKICPVCNGEFTVIPASLRRGGGIYCSKKCYGNSKTTKETRVCLTCKKEFIVTSGEIKKGGGKHCCKDCYTKSMKGSGHPHSWRGGITSKYASIRNSNESIEWRKSIFARDNYTCRHCGDNRGHNLQAHHIISFSASEQLRLDINNGITLCLDCHRKEHKRLSQARTGQLDIFATHRNFL